MIILNALPSVPPLKWREFISKMPQRSISLDGFVSTGPRFNSNGPYANFNHHEDVSRLETRATCAQVLIAVRQGLFKSFKNERGNPDAVLFVNDCDEDVSLSVFILRNSHLAVGVMNPLLNKLVFMEDMLDTTAGAYQFPASMLSLQELMWVFEPYHNFRMSGGLDSRDSYSFGSVIDDVGDRIMLYITGKTRSIELDTRYNLIGGGSGWSMVIETGRNARVGMSESGIHSFLSVRERVDGNWTYTLGRSSLFVPYPIPKFLKALNRVEGNSDGDVWGGSDIIAGSPRVKGSKLDPDTVSKIIESIVK